MSKKVDFPELDRDGDITDDTFVTIVEWNENWNEFFEFIESCFDVNYGKITISKNEIVFVTGGWSINERIIQALEKNYIFMAFFWESTHRGGKYVFKNFV